MSEQVDALLSVPQTSELEIVAEAEGRASEMRSKEETLDLTLVGEIKGSVDEEKGEIEEEQPAGELITEISGTVGSIQRETLQMSIGERLQSSTKEDGDADEAELPGPAKGSLKTESGSSLVLCRPASCEALATRRSSGSQHRSSEEKIAKDSERSVSTAKQLEEPEVESPPVWTWRYYTSGEVALHNKPHDLWVTYFGTVYNLTPLVREFAGSDLEKPILAYAGKDISHWFNILDKDIRHRIHPITGCRVPYTPHGRVPHVGLQVPTPKWRPLNTLAWWNDPQYEVGWLSARSRPLKILNVLTGQMHVIEVCSEDTMERILERYLHYNKHAASYTWKFEGRVLDMNQSLSENGIPDERDEFLALGIPENFYVPTVLIYFNDDLTSV